MKEVTVKDSASEAKQQSYVPRSNSSWAGRSDTSPATASDDLAEAMSQGMGTARRSR